MKEFISNIHSETMFVVIAIAGGMARYLNSYVNGSPFKISMFIASTFVSAFSGMMFAYLGVALSIPFPLLWMMSGVGGFFGDQTMKFIFEYLQKQIK